LIAKISAEIGMGEISATSIDTPVTPPSIKWLDNRKPLRPKPAARIPNPIDIDSLMTFITFMPKYNLSGAKTGFNKADN
jgi:hypothetical protein